MRIRIRRFGLFAVVLALVVGVFGNISIAPNVYATAKTWTGAGGNSNFSTAANWSDNSVPVNGDSLLFDVSGLSAEATLNNDLTGLSVSGMGFSGITSGYYRYTISGSPITVTGVITNTAMSTTDPLDQVIQAPLILGANVSISNINLLGTVATAGYTLSVSSEVFCGVGLRGSISGNGAVLVVSTPESGVDITANNSGFTGTFSANSGTKIGFRDTLAIGQASSITTSNAHVAIGLDGASRSISTALDLSGTLGVTRGVAAAYPCMGGNNPDTTKSTLSLAGGLSLNGNLEYDGALADTVVSAPYVTNGHALTVKSGSSGTITVPTGTVETLVETKEYSGNVPNEHVSVGNKQTAILDGTRASATVGVGGILMGTGTVVSSINIAAGGTIAPGHSPGCLTSDTLHLYGTYLFELGGLVSCSEYDQIKIMNASDTASAVNLDSATTVLSTSRYNAYTPKQGDVFVIIDQAGARAVSGTFKDLVEGATFEQNGIVFKISYVGGDGNDVTLTVQNTPTAPDTGFALVRANPVVTAAGAIIAALVLIVLGRRLSMGRR